MLNLQQTNLESQDYWNRQPLRGLPECEGAVTREERQEMRQRHNAFFTAHPWWMRGIVVWLVLAAMVAAEGLKYLLNQLAR